MAKLSSLQELRGHRKKALYLLVAQESYALEELETHCIALYPEGDVLSFEGKDVTESALREALGELSLFASYTVIVVRQLDKMAKKVFDALQQYVEQPSPRVILILSSSSSKGNTRLGRACAERGVVVEIPPIKPWEKEGQVCAWMQRYVKEKGKNLQSQAAQCLWQYGGEDRALLRQELDKLLCFAGEEKNISEDDVRAICVPEKAESLWRLCDALLARNAVETLTISQQLSRQEFALLPLLGVLRQQFQMGIHMSSLRDPQRIAQAFPQLRPNRVASKFEQYQRYGYEALKRGYLAIQDTETLAKNSSHDPALLFERLLLTLLGARSLSYHSNQVL